MALLPGDEALKTIYKFREPSDHTFTNLEKGCLRFSFPAELNDPFDCKIDYILDGNEDEWRKWLDSQPYEAKKKDAVWAYLQSIKFDGRIFSREREQEEIRSILVLSLTEINDNVLLWSHYSKYHQGFCFGFKTAIEGMSLGMHFNKDDIIFSVPGITPGFLPMRKVVYNIDMPPSFNSLHDDKRKLMEFTNVKHPDWSYEKERRIALSPPHIKQQLVGFEKTILSEVIFGYKTKDEDIRKVETILKVNYPNSGKDIQKKRAIPIKGKYQLEIVDI